MPRRIPAAATCAALWLLSGHGSGLARGQSSPEPTGQPAARAPAADAPAVVKPLAPDLEAARAALREVSALAPLAAGFSFFTASDVDAALRRGGRSRAGITIWSFLPASFAWSPRPSRQFWVLSGRSGGRALVVVLEQRERRYVHTASTVVEEPEATIALGHNPQFPMQLVFTTCYGCPGEGGAIVLREDGRVAFNYR